MNAKTPTTSTKEPSSAKVLKIATCLTLSGKSTLTYHIGSTDGVDILFRIYGNTGGGLYSNDWISMRDIQRAFGTETLVTSGSLQSACKGKSANTAGFVLAALKQEGLIGRSKDDPRKYVRIESEAFTKEVRDLIDADVHLYADAQTVNAPVPAKATGKRTAKAVKDAQAKD